MDKILVYFGALIGIFFIGAGFFLLFGPPTVDTKYQPIFGICVILYGVFRSYRSWKLIQSIKQDTNKPD